MKETNIPIGQGHGVAGRYAGLTDEYSDENSSEIVLIPVPFDKTTTYGKGSDKGPMALIEASRNMELYDIETQSEVFLRGIHTTAPISGETSQEMLENVYQKTKEFLTKDKFVVTIGGEHAISYAPIRAHAEIYQNITVLQFDAHADLPDTYENDPWSHACVMARTKELPNVSKIVSVGIRSMSKEELKNLDRPNTFFAHEIAENDTWMDQVLERLSDPVYITFDLDVFDSSLMPSTGTPEPGGLTWNQVTKILKKVAKKQRIVGFDIVELCPKECDAAPDYLAAKLIYKLLSYKFNQGKQ